MENNFVFELGKRGYGKLVEGKRTKFFPCVTLNGKFGEEDIACELFIAESAWKSHLNEYIGKDINTFETEEEAERACSILNEKLKNRLLIAKDAYNETL